jgi:menaquinone-dependent protoporphyrinogen oxidase
MNLLIAYATTDGMTARIAERVAETVRASGNSADVVDCKVLPGGFDPSRYDAILLGASMHVQGYQHAATMFVRHYLAALRTRPSGFFSVCLSVVSNHAEERASARRIAEEFPAKLGWKPDVIETIAGELTFSKYGFFRRLAMKAIAKKEMGSVDTSHDSAFTDWLAVERFARDFVARVGTQTAAVAQHA